MKTKTYIIIKYCILQLNTLHSDVVWFKVPNDVIGLSESRYNQNS